ncbi:putative disease resistance protein RGA3 [Impatiens glandulifera]|uniref:putative disease resistance protein RGA3 n=1 Tax=Impatiens glandulifera TaxID=253017 RepID=UPI001FB052CF|nr:putative disease resistance protein RGA3 [Impatiens glandulifera]
MAHDLIPTVENKEVEDVGNTIWKELYWRSFLQDEEENEAVGDSFYTTCMMHDLIHDLAQYVIKDECYTMKANSSSDDLGQQIRHVTGKVHELDIISVRSLKKIPGLQSIILDIYINEDIYNVTKEFLSVLKELLSLRFLEVSLRDVQDPDLSWVGYLQHLRCLDISHGKMKTLPDSICDLLNLQSLKLNDCSKLESLPRNMRDLINLRHLYLEGCHGLKYMPRGMRQLKHLKTLSFFVIRKEEKDCQLDEIKELDICGSLTIENLGRVSDASIARGISMAKKSRIIKLVLNWRSNDEVDDNESIRHDKISEALEVSTARLKILRMSGYKGVNLPKWVGKSSSSPTRLKSNDNSAIKDDKEMIVLFPLLEKLDLSNMENLRELVSPTIPSIGAFTNLCTLDIYYCPKLGALPPHLKSLKSVSILGECSDELINSMSNLSALTSLSVQKMKERSVLFPGAKALMFDDEIPSSSSQILEDNNNNEAQVGVHSTFNSLQSLEIVWCLKLRRLFNEGLIMQQNQGETERTRGLSNLSILSCPEFMITVEEFENLNISNSLRILGCSTLVSSKEGDALLRSLQTKLGRQKFIVPALKE